ncbi:hypothetical protein I2I05_20790 [Hymenobacter sp. BT683]|uniref:Uncharacterized protein n=1 Tax=Hymenobacter jeongseonensis TaxID=2791027 RepID=A0ABS0IPK7_9BACT|nr:hypothetical protein [Hymenobacter jeongseonensis]MBF9239843.1 hypothetical protein [Hymenobacter jeongseonensis]
MLSAYSWSQFGLFIGALVLLYYLVVGLLLYRDELVARLTKGGSGTQPKLAGVAVGGAAPPALVRPTSAFAPAAPTRGKAAAADSAAENESPTDGAAENLPTAAKPVVAGDLPASTATATGHDERTDEAAQLEAIHSAQPEAQVRDETRTEAADQVDERLARLVQGPAPQQSIEEEWPPTVISPEPESISAAPLLGGYEPLATFDEPVASLLDIITAEPSAQLVAAESVSEYIALLQAGQDPPMPAALQGSCLVEQMAQHLDHYNAELAALFAADEV